MGIHRAAEWGSSFSMHEPAANAKPHASEPYSVESAESKKSRHRLVRSGNCVRTAAWQLEQHFLDFAGNPLLIYLAATEHKCAHTRLLYRPGLNTQGTVCAT